jgi:phosphosulfolactate phosphohydrolase-like enzyme
MDLAAAEPDEGAGELVVEIIQGGRVVYRSPQLDNLFEAQWATPNINLYLQPGEQVRIMVWDVDPTDRDILVDAMVPAEQFANGQVVVSTPNGSNAILQVEARQIWAGGAVH